MLFFLSVCLKLTDEVAVAGAENTTQHGEIFLNDATISMIRLLLKVK